MDLRLEALDVEGPLRWRWLLTEESTGRPLADHHMTLSASVAEFGAFSDLYRYVWDYGVPDRRPGSEAEITEGVGAWAGEHVLGAVGAAIAKAAPVTLRVLLPERLGFVLGWPLELCHAGGVPLAARGDVVFAYELASVQAVSGDTTGGAESGGRVGVRGLRVLALFSLPSQTSVLALRRERFELARLVRAIAARQGRRVELEVVQYGATRAKLASVVEAGDGWDLLHMSGHGGPGGFLLEKPDGSPDPVGVGDLVGLLAPLRRRVRLAVVSACESGAATIAETLRWLGLEEQARPLETEAGEQASAAPMLAGVARALAGELGCAVVAMRYPVADRFAIAFARELYERLLGVRDSLPRSQGQPLGVAVARAVTAAAGPGRARVALVTPVLLSAVAEVDAAGLVLDAPAGQPLLDPGLVKLERFPPEADRFVGRAQAMAEASAALAPGSGKTGVLLHGMAGSGKTACAVELAYRHQGSFTAAAWWQAPAAEDEFGRALAGMAAALDIQLERYGFAMSAAISTTASVEAFAARLARLLEGSGLLLLLDNLESLLTPAGAWRDPRWEPVMRALIGHCGESRVILTSRIPPASLADGVVRLPTHGLGLAEAAALARELPGLRALLHADPGPLREDDVRVAADRGLVRRVLRVVQGHPKLMELADAAAADPGRLTAQLCAAEAAEAGEMLDTFFRDGVTALDAGRLLDTLAAWTVSSLATMPETAGLLARFLTGMDDGDRFRFIIDRTWAGVWRRLGRPGDPPDPGQLLDALAAAALIQAAPPPSGTDGDPGLVSYRMHPAVAQAIRAATTGEVRAETDAELAAYWVQAFVQAMGRQGGEAGGVVVRAGLAAAPYLLRLQDWDTARTLLDRAMHRDASPGMVQAALPILRAIAAGGGAAKDLVVLAHALSTADPAEAEELLRAALTQAEEDQDFRTASGTAGDLVNLLRDAGRLREALDMVGQKTAHTRRAGLGPWSQLLDQGMRLQTLGYMGEHQQVLDQIPALQAQMDALPATPDRDDAATPWNVREVILGTGQASAVAARRWQQALDLNAAILAGQQTRGAGAHEMARTSYNDYGPLIRLGRLDAAAELLAGCQQVFTDHEDLTWLGHVLTARADLEDDRGNLAAALVFQRTALRYGYARPQLRDIAIGHHNLANYLRMAGGDPPGQRAHRLAAALLCELTGMAHELTVTLRELAIELGQDPVGVDLPATLSQVIERAEHDDGVRLSALITALQSDPAAVTTALTKILHDAAGLDPDNDASQDYLRHGSR